MSEWIPLLEKLQTPALIMSAFVIWLLYSLLKQKDEMFKELSGEVNESGKTLAKMAALMDLVCAKWLGGGK
jgi:hypothetical protein